MDPRKLVIDPRCGDRLVELSGSADRDPLDEDQEDSAFSRWAWSFSAISYFVSVGDRHNGC